MRLLLLLLLSSPALANIPVQEISEVEKKDNTFEINGQWTLTPDCKIDAQVIHLLFKRQVVKEGSYFHYKTDQNNRVTECRVQTLVRS